MELRDGIITPLVALILLALAYQWRKRLSLPHTKRYFIRALFVRFFGALAVGCVYYFYYKGGDTINYFEHGSKWIWEAVWAEPAKGFRLLFLKQDYALDLQPYYRHIWFYRDDPSFFVVRVTAFFDLLTFHTYTATALLFGAFSFSGSWAMYQALLWRYPTQANNFAKAILFLPSIVFWGSGILKDSLTLGALGWLFWGAFRLLYRKGSDLKSGLLLIASAWLLASVKPYILLCFIPAAGIWLLIQQLQRISSPLLRVLAMPILLGILAAGGWYVMNAIGQQHEKYALDNLMNTSQQVAYDIAYLSGKDAGSRYTLPGYDGTPQGMINLIPQAIHVALFRPYLWEVHSPFMLLSALESLVLLLWTIRTLPQIILYPKRLFRDPFVLACLIFSLSFAFAVGISTFNFGSLVRYRIPILAPYICMLCILAQQKKPPQSHRIQKETFAHNTK